MAYGKRRLSDSIADEQLTAYEAALLSASPFAGESASAQKTKAFSDALRQALGATVSTPDGEALTASELLSARMVAWLLSNPDPSKIKDAMSIIGDVGPAKSSITISGVDADLAARAIGPLAGKDV